MSNHGADAIRASYPQTDLERLKGQKGKSLEEEKARLNEAAVQFESMFAYQLLKTMRETIPESSLSEGVPMAGGNGKEIFTQLFDMEIARKMAGQGQSSLADILYRSMENAVEAEFGVTGDPVQLQPLKDTGPGPIPLYRESVHPLPRSLPIELSPAKSESLGISIDRTAAHDNIVADYGVLISDAAKQSGLKPELIYAVIKHESNGSSTAVSNKGAKGLMQLMDTTASDYGVEQAFDPKENIDAGVRYLQDLLSRFGDVKTALAAYNAGPATVERHGGIPPFPETQEYIKRVVDTMKTARSLFRR